MTSLECLPQEGLVKLMGKGWKENCSNLQHLLSQATTCFSYFIQITIELLFIFLISDQKLRHRIFKQFYKSK